MRSRDNHPERKVVLSHPFRKERGKDGAPTPFRQRWVLPGVVASISLLAGALIAVASWSGQVVQAGEERPSRESADYASPLEVLLSPDGARLYVLCQGSEEVRVLDAASYAVIRNIAVGRVPRGFSLSPDGRSCL